jgi:hypothetical protein
MDRPIKDPKGYMFAAVGGLFACIGLLGFLIQFATGEAMFDVQGMGPRARRPLGQEFAFVFFSFGQLFLFVGLALVAESRKSRVIRYALALGNGAAAAVAFAAMFAGAAGLGNFGLALPLVWCAFLAGAYVCGTRHPGYVHSEEMERIREQPPDPENRSSPEPVIAPSPQTADRDAPPALAPLWKRMLIAGLVAWLFPVVFFNVVFALFLLPRMEIDDSFVYVFVAIGSVFLGFFFSVPVMAFVYFASKFGRQGARSLESGYREFAARLGGELVTRKVPLFGFSIPHAVLFKHGDTPTVLDLDTVGSGKSQTTYTRITFELPRETIVSCQVLPQGMLSSVGALLGAQDVRLGWDAFDDQFVIKTSDEHRAGQLLDREVQQDLLRLKQFGEDQTRRNRAPVGHIELDLRDRKLQLSLRGFLQESEALLAYYEACVRIFDRVAARLS